ncbi:hypothetical protein PR002_g4763 [Phytophthora rubi]|uniref:Uncharacterized protein n=1 Tax=Phytophthora rubi TaxID=129364 RepID=A0A6A3NKB0_9STRA|nr:hypothetical protein PR002_g4763 [Phytophthora rubi]
MGCEVLDVKTETILPPPGIEQIEIEIACRLVEVYVDTFNGGTCSTRMCGR